MATFLFSVRNFNLFRPARRLQVVLQHVKMSQFSGEPNEVLLERVRDTGVVTLNRPNALNSLNLSMIRKIYPQLKQWETDPSLKLVLIKAVGGKAFCAGGDIRAITEAGKIGDPFARDFFKEEYILNHKIGTLKKPYVALIHGITMGGGVGLSVHGPYRVATEKTVFAMPETAIGLFPDVGGGYFLPRLEGKLGIYLALTGFRLKGPQVLHAGVATHYVRSEMLGELEKHLVDLPDGTESSIEKVLTDFQKKCEADTREEFVLTPHTDDINRLFSGHTLEEIFAKLEQDGSEWATKQLNTLRKMSPTSMKITLRQLQKGGKMRFQDVFPMEYRLSQRCVEDKDFYEGVRAVVVEKDQNPKWDPATIEGMTDEKVDWYFSPLPADRELTPEMLV